MKFKIWSKSKEKYLDPKLIYINGEGDFFYNKNKKSKEDLVVCYFTGLYDKNANEVYSNDIILGRTLTDVEWEKDFSYYSLSYFYGTPCFRDSKGAVIRQWKDGIYDWYGIENIDDYEIELVGNIFENSNLLK